MKNHARLLMSSLALLFLLQEASAQTATSFEQLQVLVQKGDKVSVTDVAGKVTKGRIEDVSTSSLRLVRDRMSIELPEANILEIKKKDPLGNGAKNGALVGAGAFGGLAALVLFAFCERPECIPTAMAGTALFAGIGAGIGAAIGVGIDAIGNRSSTVYRAKPRGSAARIQIAPMLSKESKGVALSISF